jgi:hypothetical protein
MIEININRMSNEGGQGSSQTWGIIVLDENDPTVEPMIKQSLDGRTLAVVMKALRDIAKDYKKAEEDFGDPTQ